MSFFTRWQMITQDPVRLVQGFTLCRQSGIILASIVVAHVLPLTEVGIIEMLLFSGYLMTFFWSDAFLKGYLTQKKEGEASLAPTTFLIFCLLLGLLSMSVLFAARHILVPLFSDRTALPGLPLFGLYQALVVPLWLSPYAGGLKKQNSILVSVFVLIGPAFACWVGYKSLPGINGILIGLVSYALVGLVWIFTQMQFFRDLLLRKLLRTIWPVTWPLILYSISSALAKSLDAWLVAHYYQETEFAIFRYGAREFPLVVALAGGLSTIMIPRLLQPEAVGELKRRSTRLMHLCYPWVVLLMLLSPPLFVWVFGASFRESAFIFNVYLLLTLTQLIFPQTILTAKGETRTVWHISLLELGVNVTASLILMRSFGLMGIVWGTCIAFAVEKIVLLVIVRRRHGILPSSVFNPGTWLMYASAIVLSFITSIWIFGI